MSILRVEQLEKHFVIPSTRRDTVRAHALSAFRRRPTEKLKVLDRINFSVRYGETLGIMGRNGSGKSTLLKIISGIYPPDSGAVHCEGRVTPILELGVGWNPELNAIDNVHLLGGVMGLTLSEIRAALDEILEFAGLERFAQLKLRHFSSGMASRLAYSVAFRAVKEILVLDEIFAVGDASFRARCQDRYRQLRAAGHTVILVSHSPATVREFCDRVLILENGRILYDGRPDKAVEQYLNLPGSHPGPAQAEPETEYESLVAV